MMDIMNSSHSLPVIDDAIEDYNWGNFVTIRQPVADKNDNFIWVMGGFVLFGSKPQDRTQIRSLLCEGQKSR